MAKFKKLEKRIKALGKRVLGRAFIKSLVGVNEGSLVHELVQLNESFK